MEYVKVKHLLPEGGRNDIVIGPLSRKAAAAEAKRLADEHRALHVRHERETGRRVICIIKHEREP